MKKQFKNNASSNSQNRCSKTDELRLNGISEISKSPLFKNATNLCKGNEYVFRLVEICCDFSSKISKKRRNLERVRVVHEAYCKLLGAKCTSLVYSNGDFTYEHNLGDDFDNSNEAVMVITLGILAALGLNLESFEIENSIMLGLNSYLSKEFPEVFEAYKVLTNKFGFVNNVRFAALSENNKAEMISNSTLKENSIGEGDLLELDESFNDLEIFNNPLDQGLDELTVKNLLNAFMLICSGLGYKIKDENNENHQIDEILVSFSNLQKKQCEFSLDSEGFIGFKFKNEELKDSTESYIDVFLGIISCFRVNLEDLEYHNPVMDGLNEYLLQEYPEVYNAYCTLSKQFDFNRTINLGLNLPSEPDKILSFLLNMKVEQYKSDLAKAVENLPEEKEIEIISPDNINKDAVIRKTPKKIGSKRPVKNRNSSHSKNRRKAKKFLKANNKQRIKTPSM
jgi:hypothetical protein